MRKPTPQQYKIARFIRDFGREKGFGPTRQEIADQFKFKSTNAVRSHLVLMRKKGLIDQTEGKARSIRVIGALAEGLSEFANSIPLLGRIPAGIPFAVLEESAERLPVACELFAGNQLFALRVVGLSMRDAGILDGDIAILNRQEDVADGQIAAVVLNDDATLKKFLRRDGVIVLRAANPDFEDIIVRPGEGREVRIAGRLVGVLRTRHFAAA